MIPTHKMIKMRALDAHDLNHMAEQLRDGLCPLIGMVHEHMTFTLLINRFCWNHEDKIADKNIYYRSHVGLLFRHVQSVQRKGFEQHGPERILNLLNIHVQEEAPDTWIHLVFSNGHEIRLKVDKLEVYLSDLHDPWPTKVKPTHIHEHISEMSA